MPEQTSTAHKTAELQRDARESSASLADKMEALGQGLKDTWDQARGAISDSVDAAKSTLGTTVNAVQDAVQTTKDAVQDSGRALSQAIDVREHVRRQPWLMVGGAFLVGLF